MGLKDSFIGSSMLTKVCLIVLVLAQVCSWIAFTVPEWAVTYKMNGKDRLETYTAFGLWRRCNYLGPYKQPATCLPVDGNVLDWFVAVQAMCVLGFVGINIAFVVLLLQVFTSQCKSVSDIGFGNAILCIVTAILYLIGAIIFGVKFDDGYYGAPVPADLRTDMSDLGFGFALAIVAALFEALAGVLMIVNSRKNKGTSPA